MFCLRSFIGRLTDYIFVLQKQQEMIENLASLKLDILNSELRNQIDTVNLDFNIMFGATVVPRPSVMGL